MTQSVPEPTLNDVRRALTLSDFDYEAAWLRMSPRPRMLERPPTWDGDARTAAILLLLYPLNNKLHFVLTRRSDNLNSHSGQISFPGGAQEANDTNTEETALRETCEELKVCGDDVELLNMLTPIYIIVSDFRVYPHVGYINYRPQFAPDPVEVAAIIEMPLSALIDDTIKTTEHWNLHGYELDVPFYRYQEQTIWGATAIMLSEFEGRLRAIMNGK